MADNDRLSTADLARPQEADETREKDAERQPLFAGDDADRFHRAGRKCRRASSTSRDEQFRTPTGSWPT